MEHEALAYALDGDTVQNLLLCLRGRRPNLETTEILAVLRALMIEGTLRVYEQEVGEISIDLAADDLTECRVSLRQYTWLEATPGTLMRLSETA